MKSKARFYMIIIAVIFLSSSCMNKLLSEDELHDYIENEDNGLSISKTINAISIKVTNIPNDIIIMRDIKHSNFERKDGLIDSLKKHYEDYEYFKISFSENGKEILNSLHGSHQNFGKLFYNMSFAMNKYIEISGDNNSNFSIVDFHTPRTYGKSSSTDMIIVLKKDQSFYRNNWIEISIKEIGLKTGKVNFKFFLKDIKKIPHLNFNL